MERELNKQKHQRVIGFIFIVLGTFLSVVSIIAFNIYFLGPDIFGHDFPPEVSLGFLTIHNPLQFLIIIPVFYGFIGVFDMLVGLGILQHKGGDRSWH